MKPKNPKAISRERDREIKRIRKAMSTLDTLPYKPSKLLEYAITDFNKFRKGENNVVNMGGWHTVTVDKSCYACLAGAVIHQSLKNPKQTLVPSQFQESIESKLLAIDSFRAGRINDGLNFLEIPLDETSLPGFVFVPEYDSENPSPFIDGIKYLIERFKKDGL